jgi:uncharacterized protein involved in tellurium resistance
MQTESTNVWSGLVSNLSNLATDYARARYIDVESSDDDRNVQDGNSIRDKSKSTSQIAGAVVPTWVIGGAVLLVVGAIVYKFVRR